MPNEKYLNYAGLQYYHEKLQLEFGEMALSYEDIDNALYNELGILPEIPETWIETLDGTLNLTLGNAFHFWPEGEGTKTISIANGASSGVSKVFLKLTDPENFIVGYEDSIQWKNGIEPTWEPFHEYIIFLKSSDGGRTWTAQLLQDVEITPYWKVTVHSSENGDSIAIPINKEALEYIDWGDGTIETAPFPNLLSYNSSFVAHEYESQETEQDYQIIVKSSLFQNGYFVSVDADYAGIEFVFAYNVKSIDSPLPHLKGSYQYDGDTQGVKLVDGSLVRLFHSFEILESIPEKLFYNNPNYPIGEYCFYGCSVLKTVPAKLFDKSPDDTSFAVCFYDCDSLEYLPPDLFAKHTSVTSFQDCFSGCYNFKNFKLIIGSPIVSTFSGFVSNESTNVTRILCVPANSTTYNYATSYANSYNKVTVSTIDATCIPVFEYTVTTDVEYDYEDPNPDDNPLIAAVPLEAVQNATSSLTIDWGDGTAVELAPANLTESNLIHTYASAGTYHITAATSNWSDYKYRAVLYFWDSDPSSDDPILQTFRDKLISIDAPMPPVANTTLDYWFLACYNLVSIPSGLFDNIPSATGAISCFEKCYKLASIPSGLFDKNSAITSFSRCFLDCINVDGIPSGLFDNNTAATDFSGCFRSCSNKVQSIPAGLFDNNTAATNFGDCFEDCMQLQSIPAGLFDNNTAATTFRYCFSYCTKLQTIPGNLFANNTAATNFYKCFSNCRNIVNFTIHIGSSSVADADSFIYSQRGTRIVYVPSNSTTYTTFNAVASSLYLTIRTE